MRLVIALAAALVIAAGCAHAEEASSAAPQMGGWFEHAIAGVEAEAASDVSMAPDALSAIAREWRSLDHEGSAVGTLIGFGWVALAALVALLAETGTARLLRRRPLRRMAATGDRPTLFGLVSLVVCDVVALAVFVAVFTAARRHFLPAMGVTEFLAMFAASVLTRWRLTALVTRAVIRPNHAVARLIDIPDGEARRLQYFLSTTVLAVILLIGFARLGLMDEDSGAPHVIGLIIAVLICALYVLIVFRVRGAAEALIRGRRSSGMIAALRDVLARAWVPIGLTLIAGLLLIFVAGLSLGLLGYYRAVNSTLGLFFIVLVLDRLTERVWYEADMPELGRAVGAELLRQRTTHHILRAIGLAAAGMTLAWIWIDAIDASDAASDAATRAAAAAISTLLIAFIVWELTRLAIDRHLQATGGGGPALPGDDDDTGAPASRLQTILPLLRAAFGVVIVVLATLIVLSRLGVDTAPLIAGAGVFGLAVSFGSQSLVRDIISGLFYMWDDAFRVGEYIDTGRLKGTVETLGIRSVKLRHQNGPLHTIPYGQLGAVTNLSRDFATIKFNLRLDPRTDIELVRKTTKQIGLSMQEDNPELAAEIMLPLKLQGIAEVVDNALVLRFKFTSRPVKPSWVQREYLKRMYKVFAEKGITFASGAVFLQTVPPVDAGPPETALPPAGGITGAGVATAATAALGVAAALEVIEPARSDA